MQKRFVLDIHINHTMNSVVPTCYTIIYSAHLERLNVREHSKSTYLREFTVKTAEPFGNSRNKVELAYQ